MFGIPGEVFWPTVSFGVIIVLVFAGVVVLRLLPARKSRVVDSTERGQALEDLQRRLGELEERVDFTERLVATQREGQRLGPSKD